MSADNYILSDVKNGIQTIILNRPQKKNAISRSMYKRLTGMLKEASLNDNVHIVVFTGNGTFFSSGNDININEADDGNISPQSAAQNFKEFVDALITFPKLLVAIVNGPAIGIAVTMLPLFDIVFAAEKAYFWTPFANLGLSAEGCSTYTFPRIMGQSKASEMLYLCYKMNAAEAKHVGLISNVYDGNPDKIWTYLNNISKLSVESIMASKRLTKRWNEKKLLEINAEESKVLEERLQAPDFVERMIKKMSAKTKL